MFECENTIQTATWKGAEFGLPLSGLKPEMPWKYLIPAMDRLRLLCNNQVASSGEGFMKLRKLSAAIVGAAGLAIVATSADAASAAWT